MRVDWGTLCLVLRQARRLCECEPSRHGQRVPKNSWLYLHVGLALSLVSLRNSWRVELRSPCVFENLNRLWRDLRPGFLPMRRQAVQRFVSWGPCDSFLWSTCCRLSRLRRLRSGRRLSLTGESGHLHLFPSQIRIHLQQRHLLSFLNKPPYGVGSVVHSVYLSPPESF